MVTRDCSLRQTACSSRKGFTFVEVLVVMGILGMLSALLFPTLITARRSANASYCLSNLQQIGVAARLYADDWEGLYPHAISPNSRARYQVEPDYILLPTPSEEIPTLPDYPKVLSRYLGGTGVFRCLADFGIQPADGTPLAPDNCFTAWGTSYIYNDVWAFLDVVPSVSAQVPLFWDASSEWHANGAGDISELSNYKNVLYADLHVRRTSGIQLADDASNAMLGIPPISE